MAGLSGLKVQWQGKMLDEAVRLVREGHHLEAAETFDRSSALPAQQAKHARLGRYAVAVGTKMGLSRSGVGARDA